MMKTVPFFTFKALSFLILVSFLGTGSCKKKDSDPDACGTNWTTQVQPQLNAVSSAAQVYATTPTTANCNAYKTAYQNYLNALNPFVECASWTAQQKNELQSAIDGAKQQINTLCQ
jgi:hypothetical protein